MMFLFQRQPTDSPMRKQARSGMLSFSLLCLLFGFAIFAAPELLAYLIGGFFIFIGLSILIAWWNMR